MKFWSFFTSVLAALVALPLVAAGDAQAGPVGPKLPKAIKGEKCVTPTPDIRRRHMIYLDHHRDDTVHKGIRTKKFSLKGCIECHAVKGEDGAFLTKDDPRHFCRVCHDYAAVKMDCFDCHASRPDPSKMKQSLAPKALAPEKLQAQREAGEAGAMVAALQDYVKGKK